MTAAIKIDPKKLGSALRAEARFVGGVMKRGAVAAAHRGTAHLVSATQEAGKVYLSQFVNSFRVSQDARGVVLYNGAPHAGIIEEGARPHPVSQAGQEAIKRWAMRKLDLDEQEAIRVARGIVAKLRTKGQKGTFLFRNAQPELTRFYAEEVKRLVRAGAGKKKAAP